MPNLLAAYKHTSKNRAELEASEVCGCCACMEVFPPTEITAWTGLDMDNFNSPDATDGETGVCPKCGCESVIGNRSGFDIGPHFLNEMHQAWFQKTIVRRAS